MGYIFPRIWIVPSQTKTPLRRHSWMSITILKSCKIFWLNSIMFSMNSVGILMVCRYLTIALMAVAFLPESFRYLLTISLIFMWWFVFLYNHNRKISLVKAEVVYLGSDSYKILSDILKGVDSGWWESLIKYKVLWLIYMWVLWWLHHDYKFGVADK